MEKNPGMAFPARGKLKKIFLVMKLKIFLILFGCLQVHAAVYSQNDVKISLDLENVSLEEVIWAIERQTDFVFMYGTSDVERVQSLTVKENDKGVGEILQACLRNTGLCYEISGNAVVIKKGEQQVEGRKITGKVTDEKGNTLPGVTVLIKGTSIGVSTDNEGKYSLSLPAGEHVLLFSMVGMQTKEIAVGSRSQIDVVMQEEVSEMEEVVVTGIFNKSRESYTGSVTTISEKELKAAGNYNVLSAIRNIDPSFNIAENLEFGSDPNKLPDITMRGRTSMDISVRDIQEDANTQSSANLPLFILDGFEVSLQRVMDMDQELVESITLLKDASATALYGSRGANGIVVITSKRPEPGKLRVTYRGTLNIEAPDFSSYNLMNAAEKLEYERLANLYYSPYNDTQLEFEKLYNQRKIDVERGVDTYWLKYPVRTGVGHRHSLRLDGGADNFTYAMSLSYNNVAGVMKKSARNTLSGNLFFQYELENLKFQNDFTLTYNRNYDSPYGSFADYATMNPLYTPYNADGTLKKMLSEEIITTNSPQIVGNPLYNATLPYRADGRYTNIQNNFAIEWYILPELFVRGRLGLTKQEDRTDNYLSRDHTSFETDYYTGDNYKLRGSYVYSTAYYFSYEGDITLNYNKTFKDKHQLYAGFSFSFADEKSENYGFTAQGFSALNKDNIGMASTYAVDSKPSSSEEHSRRFGTILNLNYTYNHRYFADFSGKLEGSSKFGSNDKIAPFWSVGLGWNLHNENFLAESAAVNNLRLRFSYGTTGSQNFSPYQALTTYRYFTSETYEYWTGAYMIGLGNPDLTWQKTNQMNIGLEAMLFNGRVRVDVDWYNKLTESLLTDINLPISAGFESYKANVGEVRNRGVEVNANVFLIRDTQREITWSVGGSLIHNKNEILKISNSLEFLNEELIEESGSNPSFLYEEGESMNTIYVVRSLGIDPATGRELFLDREGQRTYDWEASDKVACGVNEPKVWGNLSTMFRWKGITLNAVFSYRAGGYMYNQTLVDKVENISLSGTYNSPWRNLDRRALYNRWQKPGDVAYFKDIRDFNATYASSRFVMKENTFKLNSLNLVYEFNPEWLHKNTGIDYISVGLYAEDVFQVSTIKQERGTSYPFSRKFSCAVSLRF